LKIGALDMKIVLSIIFSFTIGVVCTISAFLYRPVCPKFSYTQEDLDFARNYLWKKHDPYVNPTTNDVYKKKIDNLLTPHPYKLKIKNLNWFKSDGVAVTFFNTIYIDDDVKGINYCITLTHEILHYQYSSDTERFISYMTFKVLYESNDKHLSNASMKWAYTKLGLTETSKYDCKDLIINYLKKEK
jgi:hypothetical protein